MATVLFVKVANRRQFSSQIAFISALCLGYCAYCLHLMCQALGNIFYQEQTSAKGSVPPMITLARNLSIPTGVGRILFTATNDDSVVM